MIYGVPFSDQAQQDALYHPSFYDLLWGYLLGLQQGNPNVAGSGFEYFSYFSLYSNIPVGQIWKLADSGRSRSAGGRPINSSPHKEVRRAPVTPRGIIRRTSRPVCRRCTTGSGY